MQYNFGVGYVIGKRTDVANTMPAFFGTVQEWSLDIDQKLETLMGQFKDPVDVAPAGRTITGKIKFARLMATQFGNMLLGVNPTAASGIDLIGPEAKPAGTSYTAAAGASLTSDLGCYYRATGVALQPVTAAPTAGQYIVNQATGVYTFNAADTAANIIDIFYMRTTTDQLSMVIPQTMMGSGPVAQLNFSNPYTVGGVVKKLNIQITAARFSKAPMAFKNANYMIPEMEFTAFMDPSGTLMTWSMSE